MSNKSITHKAELVLALITSHLEINPSIGGNPPKLKNITKILAILRLFLERVLKFLIILKFEYQNPIKIQIEIKT